MERSRVRIRRRICPASNGPLGDQRHPARHAPHPHRGAHAIDATAADLPIRGSPPYQTVVFFPGSFALDEQSSMTRRPMTPSFVVKSGRAFVLPIYKSTYERHDNVHSDVSDTSVMYRDHVVMWAKDYRRTLYYLSTRADIDSTRFGVVGRFAGLVCQYCHTPPRHQ